MSTTVQSDTTVVLRSVLSRLVTSFHPEQVWLFGSRAEARAREDSDWDLLMVLPDDTPREFLEPTAVWSATCDFDIPIDVVPCMRREFEEEKTELDSLPRAAFERGRLLYVRS